MCNGEQQQQQQQQQPDSSVLSLPSPTHSAAAPAAVLRHPIPPPPPTTAAAAPNVLVLPAPRNRASKRLQEPPAPPRPHQEDHESRRGRAHDLRRGAHPVRQGLRALHPRAHDSVVAARRGEQAANAPEKRHRGGDHEDRHIRLLGGYRAEGRD